MNDNLAGASIGWGSSRSTTRTLARRRDYIPALVAVSFLTLAHLLFGASQPLATLAFSACFIATAIIALLLAGPRHVTIGMIVGAALIWGFALAGAAGELNRAAPHLAAIFAAGAMWVIGYVCARRRGALDIAWSALIWSSLAYCIWMFFNEMAGRLSPSAGGFAAVFESRADASLLFGLLGVIGCARILHVVKQMDAEALARSAMIERLLRDGLGGILLAAFAITCLLLTGSRVGIALTSAVILGHAWWDTRAIASRDHRSVFVRAIHQLTPFFALAFAAWGVGLSFLQDESISQGPGLSETLPRVQRLEAYIQAWLQQPVTGYGLGSIDAVGDRVTNLWNAKAMLTPGDAQDVFVRWLVETGAAGLAALLLILAAIHGRIVIAMGARQAPRTFARLAIAAGLLMLLHGASDSSLGLPSAVWLYALLLGAASGIATVKRTERQRPDAAAADE